MIQKFHFWHIMNKNIIKNDTCILVFIAALFTIAKTWNQPKSPSTDEWTERMQHIHSRKFSLVQFSHSVVSDSL